MKILSRYLAHHLHRSALSVLAVLLVLLALFDLIRELSTLGKSEYGVGRVFALVALDLPGHVHEQLPLAVLIGALLALTQLVKHSELTVMRVSGLSLRRIAVSLLTIGLPIVALNFVVGEFIAPPSEQLAQKLRAPATSGIVAREFRSGLWVKDDNSFINVRDVLPDATLLGVKIYEFDAHRQLRLASFAERGEYDRGNRWRLHNVAQTRFEDKRSVVTRLSDAYWFSVLHPDLLNVLLIKPELMSIQTLYSYVQYLRGNGQETRRYETALWFKLVYPLAILVMLLVAVPFALLPRFTGSVNTQIFIGIMVGVLFNTLIRLFSRLGLINEWPPLTGAVAPALILLVVAMAATWWVEKR
ncbi:MAG: LPS export ABC transporter permease LptG [Burkholderiales bacterium]